MCRSGRVRSLLLTFPRKRFLEKGHLTYVRLHVPINKVLCVHTTVRLNGVCALDFIKYLVGNVRNSARMPLNSNVTI
jgi:hypothetical protein